MSRIFFFVRYSSQLMRRCQNSKIIFHSFFLQKVDSCSSYVCNWKMVEIAMEMVCVTHVHASLHPSPSPLIFFLRNGGFACVKECTYKICTNCFVVIFLGFFCLPAQNETHLLFWRNMVNQYKHQWNKNELILFGGVRCVCAKKIIHTEYKFYWKYAYILYSKLFNARYRQQCTPTHAHRHSQTL